MCSSRFIKTARYKCNDTEDLDDGEVTGDSQQHLWHTYLLTHSVTHSLTYLLTYLLHDAESFLSS